MSLPTMQKAVAFTGPRKAELIDNTWRRLAAEAEGSGRDER